MRKMIIILTVLILISLVSLPVYAKPTLSEACSGVCSWWGSSFMNFIGATDCNKRCSQLGCKWTNNRCFVPGYFSSSKEVVVVSSINGNLADDKNKVIAFNDATKIYAVLGMKNSAGQLEWFSSGELSEAVIRGQRVAIGSFNYPVEIKWYEIYPEPAHTEWQGTDLLGANCLDMGDRPKGPECELCPDVGSDDLNYCWYQNIKSNKFWVGNGDGIMYRQREYGSDWTIDAGSSVGTKRYRAEITLTTSGVTISSPGGPDSSTPYKLKRQFYNNGITNDVHRISRRSDFDSACSDPFKNSPGCKLVSYLDSYTGVPWIWGGSKEQRDSYLGFDCAELVAGAYTQMTKNDVPDAGSWTFTGGSLVKSVVNQRFSFDSSGNTIDRNGRPLTIRVGTGANEIHIGDIFLLDYTRDNIYDHTTIFLGDTNNNGILDLDDEIKTSCHWIKETTIKNTEPQTTLGKLLSMCGLRQDEMANEKQGIFVCPMTIKQEMQKKPNTYWFATRFKNLS